MSSVPKHLSQPLPEHWATDAEGWESRERLNKNETEMLLDWLESNGYSQREVSYAGGSGFTVRWHR